VVHTPDASLVVVVVVVAVVLPGAPTPNNDVVGSVMLYDISPAQRSLVAGSCVSSRGGKLLIVRRSSMVASKAAIGHAKTKDQKKDRAAQASYSWPFRQASRSLVVVLYVADRSLIPSRGGSCCSLVVRQPSYQKQLSVTTKNGSKERLAVQPWRRRLVCYCWEPLLLLLLLLEALLLLLLGASLLLLLLVILVLLYSGGGLSTRHSHYVVAHRSRCMSRRHATT
jgi:hypothetical protein